MSAQYKNLIEMQSFTSFFIKFKPNLLKKRVFLLNASIAMTVLDLISSTHLASFGIALPR